MLSKDIYIPSRALASSPVGISVNKVVFDGYNLPTNKFQFIRNTEKSQGYFRITHPTISNLICTAQVLNNNIHKSIS